MDTVYQKIFSSRNGQHFFQLLKHIKKGTWAILIFKDGARMIKFKRLADSYILESPKFSFLYFSVEDKGKIETHSISSDNKVWIAELKDKTTSYLNTH